MSRSTDDLVVLFVANSIGVYGTTLFLGARAKIPAGAGPFTSIIETGGASPLGTHNSTLVPAYIRPSFQFVCRAEKYVDARDKAQAVYDLVFPIRNRIINGSYWVKVMIVQEPFDLQPDDVGRARVTFNIDVEKRISPATS